MMENIYRVIGSFEKNNNRMDFEKEVPANSKDRAKDLVYSELGSKHSVKRNLVDIKSVEKIDPEEAESELVRKSLEEE